MGAEDQPRDEQGRFASGGGGGGGSSGAKAWARAGGGPKAAPSGGAAPGAKEWAGGAGKPAGRNWTDKRIVGEKAYTIQEHFTAHPDRGGVPTPERAAMHEREFIQPALAGKKTAKELGEKPVAILTMGGPASGKGVILGKLAEHGLDKTHFVHVDPDEVKQGLPEYKASVAPKGSSEPTFRGAAAQVHEESSFVAKQIRDRAIEAGHHVIIDGTGGNAKSYVALIAHLQSKGYDVHVHHAHLDPDEGVSRAGSRAEGSGRFVPTKVIKGTYEKIQAAMPKIHEAAPNLTVYNAAVRGHPEAMTRREGGQEVHHDPAFVAKLPGRGRD